MTCESVMWFSNSNDLHFNEVWSHLDPANDGHWED